MTASQVVSGAPGCICEFDPPCDGTEILHCAGCGGDLCVCPCSSLSEGFIACPGCEDCEHEDDGHDDSADNDPCPSCGGRVTCSSDCAAAAALLEENDLRDQLETALAFQRVLRKAIAELVDVAEDLVHEGDYEVSAKTHNRAKELLARIKVEQLAAELCPFGCPGDPTIGCDHCFNPNDPCDCAPCAAKRGGA